MPRAGYRIGYSRGMSIEPHRWTREEYERMGADGYFHPEARVELIDGVIYDQVIPSAGS